MINVTKSFMPSDITLNKYLNEIYSSNWLTNFGNLEKKLTSKLKEFLEVENLLLTSNGTLALQVLYKALGLKGEVVTTPFSFVATVSSLVWENITPRFADIDASSLNISPDLIEKQITNRTSAILPVHVFGRCCEVEAIDKIANRYKLPIIYDAAHAFNVRYKDSSSILTHGEASILSFHATKIFHTIEGGAIVSKDANLIKECKKLINFGFVGYDQIEGIGINCKMNEFCAAMGLAVLENIDYIVTCRKRVAEVYNSHINQTVLPDEVKLGNKNYSYYPILLKDEDTLLKLKSNLIKNNITPRRYFYPSLNTLDYISEKAFCPVAENIASRILCLPMYDSLKTDQIKTICDIVNETI